MTTAPAVLVAGARGQLGSDLLAAVTDSPVVGLGSADLDITDRRAVDAALDAFLARPDVAGRAAW